MSSHTVNRLVRIATVGLGCGLLLVACGGAKGGDDPETMSCSSYRAMTADARRDAIVAVAIQLHVKLSPDSATVGEGAADLEAARSETDQQCRRSESSQVGEAFLTARDTAAKRHEPTTTKPATIPFKPARTIEWGAKDSGAGSDGNGGDKSADWIQSGATATVTVELGKLIKPEPSRVPSDFVTVLTTCTTDTALDAVIPMRVSVRNTSKVALNLALDGWLDHPAAFSAPGMTIGAATSFGSGPECQSGGVNTTHYSWTQQQVAPSATVTHDWLLIVHQYYPPDYPNGDQVPLSKALGIFQLAADSSDGKLPMETTTCYSGPRVAGIAPGVRPSFTFTDDLSNLANPGVADHLDELDGVPEC